MLEGWLEYHQALLLAKCASLDDEPRKRRPVATSLMSLHGLVRHLAEVERNWFWRILQRQPSMPSLFLTEAAVDADWVPLEATDWAADLAAWQAEWPRPGRRPPCTAWMRCSPAHVAVSS